MGQKGDGSEVGDREKKYREKRRERAQKERAQKEGAPGECGGSLTVEAALLMPLVGLLLVSSVLLFFYFHDKNIISSCAYETAVIGSTKAREKDGVDASLLDQAFQERMQGKCIFFPGARADIRVGDEEVTVTASAARGYFRLQVVQRAAVTEPEDHIRRMRRIIR